MNVLNAKLIRFYELLCKFGSEALSDLFSFTLFCPRVIAEYQVVKNAVNEGRRDQLGTKCNKNPQLKTNKNRHSDQ